MPVAHPQYDPEPDSTWEQLFQSAPREHYVSYQGYPFHTHFGQDPATDETLARMILVGQAGAIAQDLMSGLGLTCSYLMFNTFLFGGQSNSRAPTHRHGVPKQAPRPGEGHQPPQSHLGLRSIRIRQRDALAD